MECFRWLFLQVLEISQPNNNYNHKNKTAKTVVGLGLSNHWEPPPPNHPHIDIIDSDNEKKNNFCYILLLNVSCIISFILLFNVRQFTPFLCLILRIPV